MIPLMAWNRVRSKKVKKKERKKERQKKIGQLDG
jgi:hypothetical protein